MSPALKSKATLLEASRTLARYNAWMNERTYDCCDRLPDAETTLLMQAGIDPGVTDLLWLPGMEETG